MYYVCVVKIISYLYNILFYITPHLVLVNILFYITSHLVLVNIYAYILYSEQVWHNLILLFYDYLATPCSACEFGTKPPTKVVHQKCPVSGCTTPLDELRRVILPAGYFSLPCKYLLINKTCFCIVTKWLLIL